MRTSGNFLVLGDLHARDVVVGVYNDDSLVVAGDLKTRFLDENDHDVRAYGRCLAEFRLDSGRPGTVAVSRPGSGACYGENVTRPELAAAIRDLADDEKLELLGELWDSLDHDVAAPEWHKEELDRRLESAEVASFSGWSEAKARILGSK